MMSKPSTNIAPGAKPLLLAGGRVGLLIIHGYGGTPADYRSFAEQLHRSGFSVMVMRVAGHGQGHQALATTGPEDWRRSVDEAIHEFQSHIDSLVLLGSSFGGVLAIDAIGRHPNQTAGLVIVNMPFAYRGGGMFQNLALKALRIFTPYLPKLGLSRADRERYAEQGSTTHWPIAGIFATKRCIRDWLQPTWPTLRVPVLAMINTHDPIVDAAQTAEMLNQLPTADHQYIELPGLTHRPFREPATVEFMAQQTKRWLEHCDGEKNVV